MIRFLMLAGFVLAGATAQAAEFGAVQLDRSSVSFTSKQMNVPVDGAFRKFAAQISLDPAKPLEGRAQVEIDLASIDAGSAEANDEVKGKNWFNVAQFPKASFVSQSVKPLGGNRYEAIGQMSIKGKSLVVRAPFTLKQDKELLVLDGAFPLKRLDYGIGTGVWGDTSVVADEVQVKFHFVVSSTLKK